MDTEETPDWYRDIFKKASMCLNNQKKMSDYQQGEYMYMQGYQAALENVRLAIDKEEFSSCTHRVCVKCWNKLENQARTER